MATDSWHEFNLLWRDAAFELHNLQAQPQFAEVDQRCHLGKLSRDEYVIGIFEIEDFAVRRTRAFYIQFFLPWMQSIGNHVAFAEDWYCDSFASKADRDDHWRELPHWQYYSNGYDLLMAGHDFDNRRLADVRRRLNKVLERERKSATRTIAQPSLSVRLLVLDRR